MRFFLSLALLVLPLASAYAQVSVPKTIEPFEPIIISCVNQPTAEQDVRIDWRFSSDKVKTEVMNEGGLVHAWAPPGKHWAEATVVTQTFKEIVVLVPDPDDETKTKREKVRISQGLTIQRFSADFEVKGSVPVPEPDPEPDPDPTPEYPPPNAEMQGVVAGLKALMAKAPPEKAKIWNEAWTDFYHAMRDGPQIETTGNLKAAISAFLNAAAAKKGLTGAFPGYSAELEKAFVSYFGAEDVQVTREKANAFVSACAWANRR